MPEYSANPDNPESYGSLPAEQLTDGIGFLADFWREKYLQEYIRNGGSKIKFDGTYRQRQDSFPAADDGRCAGRAL